MREWVIKKEKRDSSSDSDDDWIINLSKIMATSNEIGSYIPEDQKDILEIAIIDRLKEIDKKLDLIEIDLADIVSKHSTCK